MCNIWLPLSFGGFNGDGHDGHLHNDNSHDNDAEEDVDADDHVNLREEVLPLLLDIGTPQSSFPIYSVVFHEVFSFHQNTKSKIPV